LYKFIRRTVSTEKVLITYLKLLKLSSCIDNVALPASPSKIPQKDCIACGSTVQLLSINSISTKYTDSLISFNQSLTSYLTKIQMCHFWQESSTQDNESLLSWHSCCFTGISCKCKNNYKKLQS